MSHRLEKTPIKGLYEIVSDYFNDERGSFLGCFKLKEPPFCDLWSYRSVRQINISSSNKIGSIRGLHYQGGAYAEAKLVRCINGRIWDVAVDLREDSETYGLWHSIELSPEKGNAFFIPEGFAHGFQVLEKNSSLLYIHSNNWEPDFEKGIIWNDDKLKINWPLKVTEISKRDQSLPKL